MDYDYLGIKLDPPIETGFVAYHDDTPQFSFTAPGGCIRFEFISQDTSVPDSGWIAEISAVPPPVNNDPCTAAPLPVGNSCSPGYFSNKGAYNTTDLGSPECHQYFGGDVWFSAVVPESGALKIETFAGTLDYAIMALYKGDCSSLSEIPSSCVDNSGTMPITVLADNPGDTIYIRIFGDQAKSGTFGICATDPNAEITGFTGPGGVGDSITNYLWFKADKGVLDNSGDTAINTSSVKTWLDNSGNQNDLIQISSANQASLNSTGINGLNSLNFDGDDFFFTELGTLTAPMVFYTVNDFNSSLEQTVLSLGDMNNTNTLSISRETDGRYYSYSKSVKNYGPNLTLGGSFISPRHLAAPPSFHEIFINGDSETVDNYGSIIDTDGSFHVGSSLNTDMFFDGNLSEIILYTKALNEAQEIIVNNYLSSKYSLPLSSNDKYSHEIAHSWDVAGIGRVNINNIHSKAQSAGILSIGGADDLEDGEFVLFGHDNEDVRSWSDTEIPNSDLNLKRIAREWRLSVTGGSGDGPGNINISIDANALPSLPADYVGYNVFVDSDGDFTSGAIDYGAINSGSEYIANLVSIQDGDYIAIMAVKPYISFVQTESEGLESIENPSIEVQMNYALSELSSVEYKISSGTASGGGIDYNLNQDFLIFDAGEKSKDIIPLILEDSIVEIPDEFFQIELFNPSAGLSLGAEVYHTYTINDNDIEIVLSASDTIIGGCSESSSNLSAIVSGQGPFSYSWTPTLGLSDPTEALTNANPLVTTTYTLSVTDALANVSSDSITIEVIPLPTKPVVDNSDVLAFCEGDSVGLSTVSFGRYLWNTGDTTQSISVVTGGDYSMQVQDSYSCWSEQSDTVSVTVYPLPMKPMIINSDTLEFCEGGSVDLSTDPMAAYLWSNGETAQNLSLDTTGSFSVQVQDANSCWSEASDIVNVTVNPLPLKPVILNSDVLEFCEGGSVDLSTDPMAAYLWSNGETAQNFSVDTTGSFSVQVQDANSCWSEASDVVNVTVNPLPLKPAILNSDVLEFCKGESVDLSTDPMAAYLWSNGETEQNISVDTTGSFSVKVQDANSCWSVASEVVDVKVNELPSKPVIVNSDILEFCEGGNVELSTVSSGPYLWNNGEVVQSFSVDTTGSFSLQVQGANSCWSEASDIVNVTVNPLPLKPVIANSDVLEFCEGGSVDLSTDEMNGYLWSNGETNQITTIFSSGNFSVQVQDENSCWSEVSDGMNVTVNALPATPVITPEGPHSILTGDSLLLTSSLGEFYLWSNGKTTQSIYVKESGNYSVVHTNSNSCTSLPSAEVSVTVSDFLAAPIITVNGSLSLCPGETVELSVEPAHGYNWSNGEDTRTIVINQSGSYSIIIEDDLGRTSFSSDTVEVVMNASPSANSNISHVSCKDYNDGSVILEDIVAAEPVSVEWDNGESGIQINNLLSGVYTALIRDANNCETSISAIVTEPEKISGQESLKLPRCPDASDGEISMDITGGTGPYTYNWDTGDFGSVLYNAAPGSYVLVVNDMNNCEESFSIELNYQNDYCFKIPDIITPNGDTKNDDWRIDGLDVYPDVRVEIFDRWGKRVFYSIGYETNWDGKYEGKELAMESYHYIIDLGNGSPVIIGNVTIVK